MDNTAGVQSFKAIKSRILGKINSSNPIVLERVIVELAEPELEKRKKLIVSGLEAIEKAEKELANIKADVKEYPADRDGKPLGVANPVRFSEAQVKKYEETTKRLEALYKGFQLALPDPKKKEQAPDYGPLEKALSKK